MSSIYQELFGVQTLSGLVVAFGAEERLDSMFTALFQRGENMGQDATDEVQWDEVQLARHLAPVRGENGVWPSSQNTVNIRRKSTMAHVKDSTFILGSKLYKEVAPGNMQLMPNAQSKVAFELRNLVKKIRKTIEYMAAHSLNGTLTVNAANIPGTTQAFTVTYSPNTYTASASWKTAGTLLLSSEVPALKRDFLQASGLLPKRIICDGTITDAVYANTQVLTFLQNQLGADFAKTGNPLQGAAFDGFTLGSLEWFANEAGYVPEGGSFTKYIPAVDDAFVLPGDEDIGDVLGMAEGRGIVPLQQLGPAASGASLVGLAPTRGFYAYAERSVFPNPPGIHLNVGWVGLPIVKFPTGVCVVDAVP
jgi:hypothetical protein